MLEVGPGTGNLTIRILEHAKKVIAVEVDPRMAAEVTKRVQGKAEQRKLEVLLGDVIKMEKLPEFDVLISKYVDSAHQCLVRGILYICSGRPSELKSQGILCVTGNGTANRSISARPTKSHHPLFSRYAPFSEISQGRVANFVPFRSFRCPTRRELRW